MAKSSVQLLPSEPAAHNDHQKLKVRVVLSSRQVPGHLSSVTCLQGRTTTLPISGIHNTIADS
jgi:hypothetical protein